MASEPIIRRSIDTPPEFSELRNKLKTDFDSFTKLFDSSEPEMRRIVADFQRISAKVQKMQRNIDIARTAGVDIVPVGRIAGIVGGIVEILGGIAEILGGIAKIIAGITEILGGIAGILGGIAEILGGIAEIVGGIAGILGGIAEILGGIAAIVGVFTAPLTGGLSSLVAAGVGGSVNGVVGGGVGGGVVVVGANIYKNLLEDGSMNKVEEWGKDFMKLVEPLKKKLEGIQTTCKQLEESVDGAENTLKDVEEMKKILRRVSELRKKSRGALVLAVAGMGVINEAMMLVMGVFNLYLSPEQDQKLRESIIQSADQCEKVVDEFKRMRRELRDLTGSSSSQAVEERNQSRS
ncbi:uncharacterized protein [Embiotoca jacksoni]|uniref:uncharacterized protein n=1 Tax=Embiotoca jacksoni TaxID=100190 RepID=UPI0037041E66